MPAEDTELDSAHRLIDQGQTAESEAIGRAQLAKFGPEAECQQRASWLLLLGRALEARGADADALKAYTESVELSPASVQAHVALGDLYRRLGSFEAAEHCCWSALR